MPIWLLWLLRLINLFCCCFSKVLCVETFNFSVLRWQCVLRHWKYWQNKSVFSLVPRLSTWHCPHLLLSICCVLYGAVVAERRACYRSVFPVRDAHSKIPAARRCCCRSTGQTDGRTDAQPLYIFCSSYYANSVYRKRQNTKSWHKYKKNKRL